MRLCLILFTLLICCSLFGAKERIYIQDSILSLDKKEAILILPGFGSNVHGTKKQADFFFNKGYDVYIPDYISRRSIDQCVNNLDAFIVKNKLTDYKKLHVFSYLIGSWTLNSWILKHPIHNIRSIVYDRSPIQERAPYAVTKDNPLLFKLVVGKVIFDFAKTPYPAINPSDIKIGILIESKATNLMIKHKKTALSLGPVTFQTDSLKQVYTDYFYVWLNHDELYYRFDVFGTEIMNFFKNAAFTSTAKRTEYTEDPFIPYSEQ